MKEGFTFNYSSLNFLKEVIFKNFGGGGGDRKEPSAPLIKQTLTIKH